MPSNGSGATPASSAGPAEDPGLVARVLARLAVAVGAEVDTAVQAALEELARDTGVEHAYVLLRDPGGDSVSMGYEWCAPGVEARRAALQHVARARFPWTSQALEAGALLQFDGPEDFPSQARTDRESSEAFGTRSLMVQPLRGRDGQVEAALVLGTVSRTHRWSPRDAGRAREIGDVLVKVLDREREERRLRESEALLHALTQLSPDVVSILDATGKLVFNSPAAKRIHGYDAEDLLGKNTADLWHPDDLPAAARGFEQVLARPDAIVKAQYRYRNKDGSYVWMEAVASNQLHHPVIKGIVCLSRDITDRKREEEARRRLDLEVQKLQNLESLGMLAGGVAHDFNNLLVAILGNIDLALRQLPADSPARDRLREATEASRCAADLARQMLAYAGKGALALEPIDLGVLVDSMTQVLHASVARRATLQVQPHAPLPAVEADPSQIRQVVLNLVVNAAEAMGPGGGTIVVGAREQTCTRTDLDQCVLDDRLPEGRYALLEVSDTGCGMDRETVARIFDPFFSTKLTGRGLGLAAVLGIVRGHRGAIRVVSEPGRGTTFGILLPASDVPVARPAPAPDAVQPLPTACPLLLVDDEAAVRSVGKAMLELLGFRVQEAESGARALALLARDGERPPPERIRLVVLDLTMPGMDGRETLARLRRTHPDLPVVISSGFVESEVRRAFAGAGVAGFLQKPFTPDDLRRLLGPVLAAAPK